MVEEINFPKPKIHLVICINDRSGCQDQTSGSSNYAMPSCAPRMTRTHVKEVKQWIMQQGLTGHIYCTAAQCLGFCNAEGSVACIYPSGRFFKDVQGTDDIKKIIKEEIKLLQ
jgi:(2Fe-2S) ferredoxin